MLSLLIQIYDLDMSILFYKNIDDRPFSFGKTAKEKFICDVFINSVYEEEQELEELIDVLENGTEYNYSGETYRFISHNGNIEIWDIEEVETTSGIINLEVDKKTLLQTLNDWNEFVFKGVESEHRSLKTNTFFYKNHYDAYKVATQPEFYLLGLLLEFNSGSNNCLLNNLLDQCAYDKNSDDKINVNGINVVLLDRNTIRLESNNSSHISEQVISHDFLKKQISDWKSFKQRT